MKLKRSSLSSQRPASPRLFRASTALLAAWIAVNAVSGASAAAQAAKIAVANTGKIFNQMQETKDLKEKLEARRQELSNEEKDRREKIKGMEDNLKNLKPDHPQFKKGLEELDNAMAGFESWGKVVRLEAERDQKQQMLMLFDKLQSAVAQVAKNDGIDLVVADQGSEIPNTEGLTFDQLRALINQRDVLYSSSKADISDEVLTLLDAQYAKEKAK